ncbi:hypothetical protein L3081_06485 [Colwellia sp. MSW7]|jgi:hypothetical protein|uniref:Uncharacterized protein n=1 Tax=Colwellia maritima TaxID=2912588 RepID=A0ABS9WYP2_9GAMM|nr:hypothetical protein [Colwellia maritima]MCI2283109.1 hypothetical protein [Colwellia maritima]
MTLPFRSKQISAKKPSTMTALALVVFVVLLITSTFVHASHVAINDINIEQQECYICHQGLDTPPDLSLIKNDFIASYCYMVADVNSAQFKVNTFVQPHLRAPPVF